MRPTLSLASAVASVCAGVVLVTTGLACAEDDARMKQLRLLCAQLSGDLTDPGGMAAFRRCLSTHDPLNEIRRDNNIAAPAADRPNAAAPQNSGRNSRFHVADNIERFQLAEPNLIYVLNSAGKLWRGTVDGKEAYLAAEDVAGFELIDAHLFIQGTDGVLWRSRLDGSESHRVDKAVAAFKPIDAGVVYVLAADHTLWRETGDAGKRSEVDHTVKDFQAIDDNLVFVLGADGQLWRETGNAQSRTPVAKDIVAFQYFPQGDTVYVQTADAVLWRKIGNGNPQQVDQSVAAFQAMDAQMVFVLGRDGRLWRELGERNHSVLVDRDVLVTAGKSAFHADNLGHVLLLGSDHKLWLETLP